MLKLRFDRYITDRKLTIRMMLVEAGVGKAGGRFEELMLVEAVVGEVARLLVEGMVLALLATIEMKTEDQ